MKLRKSYSRVRVGVGGWGVGLVFVNYKDQFKPIIEDLY